MNMKRNLRIASIVAMANGGIALWLLPPGIAQADTCSAANGIYCDMNGFCPTFPFYACALFAPQGCNPAVYRCLNSPCTPGNYSSTRVYCTFRAV
jgi:hypothetical protein